jgi:uncharacterized lipoprotein YddW (UPF0748 family)
MKSAAVCLALALVPLGTIRAEFRGAWIASVHNINFPSKAGLPAATQQAELARLLDAAARAGLRHVLLQVRPESDALYQSPIEPWSRFLTGTQGTPPGYDPLAFAISEGRKRGIHIHAWLNPYRASASASKPLATGHVARRFPQLAYRIGSVLWMDPGAPAVQDHIVAVVKDLCSRYELAGVHFDDYFYPYPDNSGNLPRFPDDITYAAHGAGLSKADWRRRNVNSLLKRVHQTVKATRPSAVFGVSPFGIYTKGVPPDVKAGVDQYHQLFSDPVRWMKEGSVDYLAPQLYWKEGGPQSFSSLLRWWRSPEANPRGVPIIPGIAVDRINSHGWDASEIARQLAAERSIGPRPNAGFLLWNIGAVRSNAKGVVGVLK